MSDTFDAGAPSSPNGDSWPPVRQLPGPVIDPSNLPTGRKSLSGISLRAFFLGTLFGTAFLLTLQLLLLHSSPLWRPCLFISTLSLFHFLEYFSTARFNPVQANLDAFLLSSNGSAYNIAHTAALLEFFVRTYLLPPLLPSHTLIPILGIILIALGQPIRTLAMAYAGPSFNHVVQYRKAASHNLVTTGIYGYFRHPSYAGYFWWALGTQLMLGNAVCLCVYAIVLWRFFSERIEKEENSLVYFFGQDYVRYRERTRVWIPFIP